MARWLGQVVQPLWAAARLVCNSLGDAPTGTFRNRKAVSTKNLAAAVNVRLPDNIRVARSVQSMRIRQGDAGVKVDSE